MPAEIARLREGDWNQAASHIQRLARDVNPFVPQARVYNNAAISIATSGVDQALTFNSERWDNGGLHSTTANTGRLTAPITGLYEIGCCVSFAANAAGSRYAYLRLNGATIIVLDARPPANGLVTVINLSTEYQLVAGDYVEVVVNQSSGGALNVSVGANYSPEFWMHRIAGYVNQGV